MARPRKRCQEPKRQNDLFLPVVFTLLSKKSPEAGRFRTFRNRMPKTGIEPARYCYHQALNLLLACCIRIGVESVLRFYCLSRRTLRRICYTSEVLIKLALDCQFCPQFSSRKSPRKSANSWFLPEGLLTGGSSLKRFLVSTWRGFSSPGNYSVAAYLRCNSIRAV